MTFGDGGPFATLFEELDQDRVVQFLSGCDGAAQSLHASLPDVRGTRVRVQLFHKGFENAFGQSRHVIGVLEASDGAPPEVVSPREDLEAPRAPMVSGWKGWSNPISEIGRMNNMANSSGSESGSSSGGSSGFIPLHSAFRDDVLEFQVDKCGQNLRILSCTSSVTSVLGPVEDGTGLLDLVDRRHHESLRRWVQQGGSRPQTVTLQHTSIRSLRHRATCVIRDDGDGSCSIVLSDVRSRFRRSASQYQAGSTGTQGTERCAKRRMSL